VAACPLARGCLTSLIYAAEQLAHRRGLSRRIYFATDSSCAHRFASRYLSDRIVVSDSTPTFFRIASSRSSVVTDLLMFASATHILQMVYSSFSRLGRWLAPVLDADRDYREAEADKLRKPLAGVANWTDWQFRHDHGLLPPVPPDAMLLSAVARCEGIAQACRSETDVSIDASQAGAEAEVGQAEADQAGAQADQAPHARPAAAQSPLRTGQEQLIVQNMLGFNCTEPSTWWQFACQVLGSFDRVAVLCMDCPSGSVRAREIVSRLPSDANIQVVDGRAIDSRYSALLPRVRFPEHRRGAPHLLAASLSHIEIVAQAARDKLRNVLILEDDAVLVHGSAVRGGQVSNADPLNLHKGRSWNIIRLGYVTLSNCIGSHPRCACKYANYTSMPRSFHVCQLVDDGVQPQWSVFNSSALCDIRSTSAYAVSYRAFPLFARLRKLMIDSLIMPAPIDMWIQTVPRTLLAVPMLFTEPRYRWLTRLDVSSRFSGGDVFLTLMRGTNLSFEDAWYKANRTCTHGHS